MKKGDISAALLLMLNMYVIIVTRHSPEDGVPCCSCVGSQLVKLMSISRTCFYNASPDIHINGSASVVGPSVMHTMDSTK